MPLPDLPTWPRTDRPSRASSRSFRATACLCAGPEFLLVKTNSSPLPDVPIGHAVFRRTESLIRTPDCRSPAAGSAEERRGFVSHGAYTIGEVTVLPALGHTVSRRSPCMCRVGRRANCGRTRHRRPTPPMFRISTQAAKVKPVEDLLLRDALRRTAQEGVGKARSGVGRPRGPPVGDVPDSARTRSIGTRRRSSNWRIC